MSSRLALAALFVCCLSGCVTTGSEPNPAHPFIGEYTGTFTPPEGDARKAKACVFPVKDAYRVVLTVEPAGAKDKAMRLELVGKPNDDVLHFRSVAGTATWEGKIAKGRLTTGGNERAASIFDLKRTVRTSPTEGAKPPKGAVVLLPFDKNKPPALDAWRNKTWKPMPDGSMEVGKRDNHTVGKFADVQLHIEFRCPLEPNRAGQGRGNSGVYLQGRYEVQVLDSFGLVPGGGDCGAIYGVAPPKVNTSLPPLRWQTYDITFHAPRLGPDGKIIKHAEMTVLHNGIEIHDRQVIRTTTRAGGSGALAKAPLMVQDHGNKVRYRNIWLIELKREGRKAD